MNGLRLLGCIISHPKDFTPVCTTEFSAVAQLADEWAIRKTKVIGVSVDSIDDHKNGKKILILMEKANLICNYC